MEFSCTCSGAWQLVVESIDGVGPRQLTSFCLLYLKLGEVH